MKFIAIQGQTTSEAAWTISVFGISLMATALFGYYLFTQPERLVELWHWTRSLNIFVQGVIWVIFLPWMVALWIWSTSWALPIRLVLVVAVFVWMTWMLYPWK